MAVVAVVTNGLTRINAAENTTGYTAVGSGTTLVADSQAAYQGTNSLGVKSKSGADYGVYYQHGSTTSMSANNKTWLAKTIITTATFLPVRGATAHRLEQGDGARSNYYSLYLHGNDTYPPRASWILAAWNPNLVGYRSATTGSPTITAFDYWATIAQVSGSVKAENIRQDAIDLFDDGGGLTLTGGDSTDPDGTFQDFADADEGTLGNRWGIIGTEQGVFQVLGRLTIGSATATVFTDANVDVIFPKSFYDVGFSAIAFGLQSASNVHTLTACKLKSNGLGNRMRFDTEDVNAANDYIVGSDFADLRPFFDIGDSVIVRSQGGTETPGPTDGTRYWVGHDDTNSAITLHTTMANAVAATTPVALTASTAGNGEIWRIDADIDTRAEFLVTGTSGTLDLVGGTLQNMRLLELQSVVDFDLVNVLSGHSITLNGANMTDCVFTEHTTIEGESYIVNASMADFVGCLFDNTGGRGHAIRITGTGTQNSTDNTFTGYFSAVGQALHQFDNTTDVTGGATDTITLPAGHGYTSGSAVVYSKVLTANTAVGGLTDETTYYVGVTGNDMTIHLNEGDAINGNAPISLTVGTGNETHALWPANAAVFNDSGGALTIAVSGGSAPSIRNGLDATTVISNAVTVSIAGVTEGTPVKFVASETVGTVTSGDVLGEGFADSAGEFSFSQDYEGAFDPSGLDVRVVARNQGVAVAAISDDGGVFTDETTEASSNTTADMTLLPAVPVAGDAYYFAHSEQFTQLRLDISTALVQSVAPTLVWEYWNGSSWGSLTGVSDGTGGLENTGPNVVSWTLPGDWATTTVNSQGPLYYVRVRLSAAGTISTAPVGRKVTLDVSRYLPYTRERVITSSGLQDVATWTPDTISQFNP